MSRKSWQHSPLVRSVRKWINSEPGLSDVGRREEAIKETRDSVNIYRELTEETPAVFVWNLFIATRNLTKRLDENGQPLALNNILVAALMILRNNGVDIQDVVGERGPEIVVEEPSRP